MKKMSKIVLSMFSVAAIATLASCGASQSTVENIKKNGKLIVSTNAEFAPFEYIENNEFTGFDMDFIKAYADYLGVDCEIQNIDFDAALISVSKGKSDVAIAAITKNDKREETMSFSDSYYTANQVVIVKKGSAYESLTTKESLLAALSADKAIIGAQRGTTGQYYIEGDAAWEFDGISDTTCVPYDNGGLAVAALTNGQIQAVIIDIAPAQYYCQKNTNVTFNSDIILTEEEYAIAVSKGNTSLITSLNEFIAESKSNGTYEAIVQKYFGN